jgi:hypothetical protein
VLPPTIQSTKMTQKIPDPTAPNTRSLASNCATTTSLVLPSLDLPRLASSQLGAEPEADEMDAFVQQYVKKCTSEQQLLGSLQHDA